MVGWVVGVEWVHRGLVRLAVRGWPRRHRVETEPERLVDLGVTRGRVDQEPRRCHGLVGRSAQSTDTFNTAVDLHQQG